MWQPLLHRYVCQIVICAQTVSPLVEVMKDKALILTLNCPLDQWEPTTWVPASIQGPVWLWQPPVGSEKNISIAETQVSSSSILHCSIGLTHAQFFCVDDSNVFPLPGNCSKKYIFAPVLKIKSFATFQTVISKVWRMPTSVRSQITLSFSVIALQNCRFSLKKMLLWTLIVMWKMKWECLLFSFGLISLSFHFIIIHILVLQGTVKSIPTSTFWALYSLMLRIFHSGLSICESTTYRLRNEASWMTDMKCGIFPALVKLL